MRRRQRQRRQSNSRRSLLPASSLNRARAEDKGTAGSRRRRRRHPKEMSPRGYVSDRPPRCVTGGSPRHDRRKLLTPTLGGWGWLAPSPGRYEKGALHTDRLRSVRLVTSMRHAIWLPSPVGVSGGRPALFVQQHQTGRRSTLRLLVFDSVRLLQLTT